MAYLCTAMKFTSTENTIPLDHLSSTAASGGPVGRCLFLAGSTTVPLDCDLMLWSSPPVRPQLHLRTICLAQLLLVVSGMVCNCCWPVLLLFFIHFLHINLFVYIMFLAGSAAVPHTFSSHHSPCIHHVSSRFYGCSSYIFFTSISLYTSCF